MPAGMYEHKKMDPDRLLERATNRFWSRVKKMDNGCWEWQGARLPAKSERYPSSLPYGLTSLYKKQIRAHRFAWEITNGPIPEGSLVLHHCDNPPCVNPEHLYVGDYFDNMRDRRVRGRNVIPQDIRNKWAIERKSRYVNDPTLATKVSKKSRELWAAGIGPGSPEAAAKRVAAIKARYQDPAYLEEHRARMKRVGEARRKGAASSHS